MVSPESLEARIHGSRAVLAKHGIRFRHLRLGSLSDALALDVDLGTSKEARNWTQFQEFLSELGERANWSGDLDLSDSAHGIRVSVSFNSLGSGNGGVWFFDSSGFFHPPTLDEFPDGIGRIRISNRKAGIDPPSDLPLEAKYYPLIRTECSGFREVNGHLFYELNTYQIQLEDPETWETSTTNISRTLRDASDGKVWKLNEALNSLPFRGERRKTKFLRPTLDTSGHTWRMLQGVCWTGSSDQIWQYRPFDHRLQLILLKGPKLAVDLRMDTLGIPGEVLAVSVPERATDGFPVYSLVRDGTDIFLYRSVKQQVFGERWRLRDSSLAYPLDSFSVSTNPDDASELQVHLARYAIPVEMLVWLFPPAPPKAAVASSGSCDTCADLDAPGKASP